MSIYVTDKKETGFYGNISEKRVVFGMVVCALAVLFIGLFIAFGDTSFLQSYPTISMAVAIWFLGYAIHNLILVILFAHQNKL